ncbi:hypothetical protein BO82DRAFT_199579 [Aspergillus uvarum CBS 121591]|uniref:Bacteriophage T5 Orf172 DNA-binding domain-containing protein n=1 Tax=Aspergillus uvarum CBS 121591 TaxID=1448315 RepID=A0A319DAR9_9EURO|nr:hypothetical protein BO82DRAFT_199579 [Aspergillus uvarum CBS 121591]PYH85118.1 hypothetical protein BO82DRAFT_199579 [Aspergillus uvarum CBS 121591]
MSTWFPFAVTHVRGYSGNKNPVRDDQTKSRLPSETRIDLVVNAPRESFDGPQGDPTAATPTRRGHSNPINDQRWQNRVKQGTGRSHKTPEMPTEPHSTFYQSQESYGLPSPNDSISEEGETLVPSDSEYDSDTEEPDVIQVKHLSQDVIIKKMIEALSKKCDDQPGYVYTFYNPDPEPGTSNIVKVGQAIDPEKRGEQHKSRCERTNWKLNHAGSFRGYQCVERLVLIELHNLQSDDVCRCGTRHREYFKADETDASALIKSWQTWLQTYEPYTSTGVLKTVWKDRLDLFGSQPSKLFLCKTCETNRTVTSDSQSIDCCIRAGWEAWANPTSATYKYQSVLALIKDTRASHSLTKPARCLLAIICLRLLIPAILHHFPLMPASSNAIFKAYALSLSLGVVFDLGVSAILLLWISFVPNREIARIEGTEASKSPRKESKARADSVKESCTTPTKSHRKKAADKTPPSTPKRTDTKTPKSSPTPREGREVRVRPGQEPSVTPTKSSKTKSVGRRSKKVSDSPPTIGNETTATNVSSNMTPLHQSATTWPIDTSTPPALVKVLERSFDSNPVR